MKKKKHKQTGKKTEEKRGRGRPSKVKAIQERLKIDDIFSKESLKKIEDLAAFGLIDEEIAIFLDIAPSSLHLYKLKHPEFSESLKRGKLLADLRVVKSLFQRANGYEHPEEKIFVVDETDDKGNIKKVPLRVPTIKHYPPSEVAMLSWLHNRRPQDWRDRRNEKVEPTDKEKMQFDMIAAILQDQFKEKKNE